MPFWKVKTLAEMSPEEWESLCDRCGRCCLEKLEDVETGEVIFTNVACNLLDIDSCRCTAYQNRTQWMPDCLLLTPDRVEQLYWLPTTCAYRLMAEGKDLQWWHHLVSGDPNTVHQAGVSVSDNAVRESFFPLGQLKAYRDK